ncbi:LPP leucine zipper domain-containing protein [Succinimonas amylolytica]|uniref:LPP leucine zipper domain-containing protein n=1 Tax=Succinimonas amylolytica TaxID=83769 RepID=UPI0003A8BC32|nr:LPP leucine zipper domain-containing protein [Succinimonas amylolytica]
MNKLQVVLGTVVLGASLVGCANTDALSQKVDALSQKVDALSADVAAVKSNQNQLSNEVAAARADAARANERLDNMANRYKK